MVITLIKSRLAATFSGLLRSGRNGKSRSKGKLVLMGLLGVYVLACFAFLFGSFFSATCVPFEESGMGWFYYSFAGIMAFALCFVGSVFMAQHQIFEAKDNEMLLAMPVPPRAILLSRMAALYVFNLIYCLLVMAPAAFVRWTTYAPGAAEVVIFVLEFLLIPLLSMALSCLFGWLFALIGSKMRSKNLITLVFSLAFLAAYFYFFSKIETYIQGLVANGASIAAAIQKGVLPAYYMGTAAANASFLDFLIFAACAIIPFAIVVAIINANFIRITTTKSAAAKVKYTEKRLKAAGARSALLRKELKHFLGNAMYIMNAGIGTIMMVVLSVALIFKQELLVSLTGVFGSLGLTATALGCVVMCFLTSMNCISAPSISLEAKTLWLVKSLPVSVSDTLMAKAEAHIVACLPGILVSGTIMNVLFKSSVEEAVLMYLLPAMLACFGGLSGVMLNLHLPKFDWINEVACVKQGMSVVIAIFLGMGVVILPVLLYFFLLSKFMGVTVFLYLCTALFALLSLGLYLRIKTAGVRLFEAL